MGKNIVVLGAGLVGSTIAIELSKQYSVTVADIDNKKLQKLNRCYGNKIDKTNVTQRKNLEKIVENDGGNVTGTVTSNTTLVVYVQPPGKPISSKLKKAKELNAKISKSN